MPNKLRTLGRTTWNKIKIGEVFAVNACWCIYAKMSDGLAIELCGDMRGLYGGDWDKFDWEGQSDLYKLPIEVQRLWMCDK